MLMILRGGLVFAAFALLYSGMNSTTITSDHCIVKIDILPPEPMTMEA